jgi:hypothetical protein
LFPRQIHSPVDEIDEFLRRKPSVNFDDVRQRISGVVTNFRNETDEVRPRKCLDLAAGFDETQICVTADVTDAEAAAETADALKSCHGVGQNDARVALTEKDVKQRLRLFKKFILKYKNSILLILDYKRQDSIKNNIY